MYKISEVVQKIIEEEEDILLLGSQKLINTSSYARKIRPYVEKILMKEVKEGSIVAALNRFFKNIPEKEVPKEVQQIIDRFSVHSKLEGITIERTETNTSLVQNIYKKLVLRSNSFITITQGVNEITIVSEAIFSEIFRENLKNLKKIYDKRDLVGISIKFHLKFLEIPNILFQLHKRIVVKKINIIEMISTATELTFIIEKKDLQTALDSMQKFFSS